MSAARRKGIDKAAISLSWQEAIAGRLHRQHLDRRTPRHAMLEVVADIGGLHAQLMSSAELTLWARVEDLEPDAVQRALWEERSLVKTWAMRGTLHLLPAAEFGLWQAALSAYQHYRQSSWLRYFGLSAEELDRLLSAVADALDGRMLTREELAAEVSSVTGSTELGAKLRESWGALLKPAAYLGYLCFAPNLGRNVRFTRPDRWLADSAAVDPAGARLQITRRFLAACGPATREDYARWWGTTPREAAELIAGLGEEVTQVDVDGTSAWMLSEHVGEAAGIPDSPSVRLLPAFDQYVVGAPRNLPAVLPTALKDRVYRSQGWLSPVLLVDGRMEGVWRHERKGSRITVRIEPFGNPGRSVRRGAQHEAERFARFLGADLQLTWGSP